MNGTNRTADHEVAYVMYSHATLIAVIVMLSIFFFVGTIGNALAFIIYYRKREKGTSTIFILSLTVTDFFICLICIPWTLYHELAAYRYPFDIFCRGYVFMNTFNIPLSSFILVVIGFDRYFCICHPFLHIITVPRAKIIVCVLIFLAALAGVVPALGHSLYYYDQFLVNITVPVETISTSSPSSIHHLLNDNYNNNNNYSNSNSATGATSLLLSDDGNANNDVISAASSLVAAAASSSNLPTTSLADYIFSTSSSDDNSAQDDDSSATTIASELYTDGLNLHPQDGFVEEMQHGEEIAYKTSTGQSVSVSPIRYVVKQINQSQITTQGSCSMSTVTITLDFLETYQGFYASLYLIEFIIIMILYALIFRSIILRRAWRAKRRQKSSYSTPSCVDTEETQLTNVNGNGTEVTSTVKKTSSRISAAMRDRTLYANIRTAAMLFVVTVVFVLSFLPSWLTTLRMIEFNLLIYYTFYFNNVANPIIYAFMNRTFRDELVLLIKNCLCNRF